MSQPIKSNTMYAAALYRDNWLPFDGEAVTFDGVTCCIFVDEFGDGEIRVELVPEREDERDQWPLDVLRLSKDRQEEILNQLT